MQTNITCRDKHRTKEEQMRFIIGLEGVPMADRKRSENKINLILTK